MVRGFGADTGRFLLDLERIQQRAARAQTRISSGYKVNAPSDAPAQVSDILHAQLELAEAVQTKTNLQRVQAEVNASEAVVRDAVRILQDVNVAAAQGVDGLATTHERTVLAAQVKNWHGELVRLANSSAGGRYLFGGDQDQSVPYSLDWTQPGGVIRLQNSPDTRVIEDVSGNGFPVSRRAEDLFDLRDSLDAPAPGNVFHALYNLSLALDADDPVAISAAAQQANDAFDHVNRELATFGTAQSRVETAIDAAQKKEVSAKARLSELRDADLPEAILELTQSRTSLEAALGAQAQMPRTTLFDYFA